MKRLVVLIATLFVTPAFAGESAKEQHTITNVPPAFEHLKSLVGTWEGVATGDSKGTTTFEIVASGSAILERMAPMGEPPMINVYHPDGDAVVMTHYCGSGNQPRMRCTKDGSSLVFTMMDITNWKKGKSKMDALTLVMVDADHLKQEWVSTDNGKKEPFTIELVRKK